VSASKKKKKNFEKKLSLSTEALIVGATKTLSLKNLYVKTIMVDQNLILNQR